MIYDPLAIEYNRGYNAAMEKQLHYIDREKRRFTAAVAAMQGLLANPDKRYDYEGCATDAVLHADALLKELEK